MKRAWITESAHNVLVDLAGQSAPLETGGILVGVLRDDDPWIVMAVEIEDPGRGRSRFTIPQDVTPAVIELTRQIDARFGYVGDWHTHPANLPTSEIDKGTLQRSARRPRRGKQPALLIVVRARPEGWDVEAFADAGAGAEPLELRLTGELPPPHGGAEFTVGD
jgi:integrative and conjugative element protein (TIGR02256 family)